MADFLREIEREKEILFVNEEMAGKCSFYLARRPGTSDLGRDKATCHGKPESKAWVLGGPCMTVYISGRNETGTKLSLIHM